jgi:hypothetical protein
MDDDKIMDFFRRFDNEQARVEAVVNASTATTADEVFHPRLDAKDRSVREAASVAAGNAVLDARCSFAWRRAKYLARQSDRARTGRKRGHADGGRPADAATR